MAKPEWGVKRMCASCGARFYDLLRNPIVCPKCEAVFDPADLTRPRRAKAIKMTETALVEDDDAQEEAEEELLDEAPIESGDDNGDDEDETPAPKKATPGKDEDDAAVLDTDESEDEDEDGIGNFDDGTLLDEDGDEIKDIDDAKRAGEPES